MRISDWSSDVCSSDLHAVADGMSAVAIVQQLFDAALPLADSRADEPGAPSRATAVHAGLKQRLARGRFGLRRIWSTLRGHGVGSTVLLGERSAHRGVVFVEAGLDSLAARDRYPGD